MNKGTIILSSLLIIWGLLNFNQAINQTRSSKALDGKIKWVADGESTLRKQNAFIRGVCFGRGYLCGNLTFPEKIIIKKFPEGYATTD